MSDSAEPDQPAKPAKLTDAEKAAANPRFGTSTRNSGSDDPAIDQLFSRGRLVQMPSMRRGQATRDKLLRFIATSRFEAGVVYTEPEVNERLMGVYDDYSALRRYLIEDGHLTRDRAGREYRLPA